MALDYYERVKDRADNGGEPERMDEDTAYEMARQDRVDVELTRTLDSIYRNTDLAARFVMDEIRAQAQQASNAA